MTAIMTVLIVALLWSVYHFYNKVVVWMQSKIPNYTERYSCEQR